MMKSRISFLLLGSSFLALSLAGPAWAQSAGDSTASPGVEAVTVTGSRVASKGFDAPTPTTVLSSQELEAKAALTVTDIISEIPSLAPNQNNNNSQNVGVTNFDLRNIGATRTLVLIDGLRVEDTNPTGGFNVNVIPAQLVDHVDIVTGGASSAYGSDAITGVVNVSLKSAMTGGKIDFQQTQSNYGDDRATSLALTYGNDFFGGKAQWVFAGSYYSQPKIIYENARPWGRLGYTEFQNTAAAVAGGAPVYQIGPGGTLAEETYGGVITTNAPGLKNVQFLGNGATAPFNPGGLCGSTAYCQNGDGVQTYNTPDGVLLPKSSRTNLYTKLTYDLTPALQAWASILYSYDAETGTNVPNYDNGTLNIGINNAFLPASIVSQMKADNLTSITIGKENLQDLATVNVGETRYLRYVAGLKGAVPWVESWNWDADVMYTQANWVDTSHYNRIVANWNNAVNSELNPAVGGVPGVAAGTPICVSTIANPTNGCVPANVFGPNSISQSAQNYYLGTSYVSDWSTMLDFAFNMHGDLFHTWAGPIGAALGGEYRRNAINQTSDPISHTLGWRQASAEPFYGANEVREGYAEFVVPLTVPNIPLMENLNLDIAGRVVNYDTSGTAFVWKTGLDYSVNDQIRFRGTYSKDFRAPNVNDLFSTPLISNGATVTDKQPGAHYLQGDTIQTLTGGNPNLKPEQAKTLTAGIVLTPSFLPGFMASVDAYNINMANAISTFSVQQVVDGCYLNNISTLCSGITRNPATGQITVVSATEFNAQVLKVNGIDLEGSYLFDLSMLDDSLAGSTLVLNDKASYVEHITTTVLGVETENAGYLTGTNSLPHWRDTFSVTYNDGPLNLRALMYYIGPGFYAPGYSTPQEIQPYHWDGYTYFDLSGSYQITDRIQLYGKINNLLNQNPPMIANNATLKALADSSLLYDQVGRLFGVGVRYTF
ncbi:MAG TPA: TonB-dependent receptor [Rhizomicrobium sp.]|jgi:outer membrane receptor protein involved in Fe transport|nr:TonB-dependent receptor [Rhizomicrobium sp.]